MYRKSATKEDEDKMKRFENQKRSREGKKAHLAIGPKLVLFGKEFLWEEIFE